MFLQTSYLSLLFLLLGVFNFILANTSPFSSNTEPLYGPNPDSNDISTFNDLDLSQFLDIEENHRQEIEDLNGLTYNPDAFLNALLDPSPLFEGSDYNQEIVSALSSDYSNSFINGDDDDDFFFAPDTSSTSCLLDNDEDEAVHLNKLFKRKNSFCHNPEETSPINVPQFPNNILFPSVEQPEEVLPPTSLDKDNLAPTRSAEFFCASEKYRVDIRIGRMLVPVCGPGNIVYALPPQQGWPGYGVGGYYPNVEFSRASKCVVIVPW